jgi:N-acetylglucosamine-6-sulfatase
VNRSRNRRRLIGLLLGVTAALAIAAPAAHATPNVVVIETDDQTVESMKVMDNVNSLIGDHGTTFSNSFVNFSLCCPSRATFLTGQYAHNHGVISNAPPDGGFPRFESLHGDNNLAVWLQDAGYYTALVGKHLNRYANDPLIPPGWSEWYASSYPSDQAVYDYTLNENGTLVHYGTDVADFKQDVFTSKAVDFVERRAPNAQPFFLWLTYTAPHISTEPNPNPPFGCDNAAKPAPRHASAFGAEPLPQTPDFNEEDVSDKPAKIRNLPLLSQDQISDIQRKYRCELGSLLSVDEGVEQVVNALSASGELDDTLIVYTSDNGYFHGEHRLPGSKRRLYEESIRVPLEMRGPGVPSGATVDDPTINADLAPTIADAADATPGLTMDGRSLIPLAQQPGIERGRELLIEEPGNFSAIRTERYMFARHWTGEEELYDLQSDPFELVSLHDDPAFAPVKTRLDQQLKQLKACAGAGCLLHFPPPSSLSINFSPSDLPDVAFKSGRLTAHAHADYESPGHPMSRAELFLDDDLQLDPSGTPECAPTRGDLAKAMAQCGSARIGSGTLQASADGAYTINGCVLAFNGPPEGSVPTVILFARLMVANPSTISCANPSTNHQGNRTVILSGRIADNDTLGGNDLIGGKAVDIDDITTASAFPLTDLNLSLNRGSYVGARCGDADHRLNLRATLTYDDGATRTLGASKACT